jgi:hypothetical protein
MGIASVLEAFLTIPYLRAGMLSYESSTIFYRIMIPYSPITNYKLQITNIVKFSVADPDPGSGAFLTPGSGMGRKIASGSGIRDEQPGSYFLELRNHFLVFFGGLTCLNSLMWIRDGDISDPGWKKVGSGMNIPDPQHW